MTTAVSRIAKHVAFDSGDDKYVGGHDWMPSQGHVTGCSNRDAPVVCPVLRQWGNGEPQPSCKSKIWPS